MTPSIKEEELVVEGLELLRVRVVEYYCNAPDCECGRYPFHLWAGPAQDDAWMFIGWAKRREGCEAKALDLASSVGEDFVAKAALMFTLNWAEVLSDPVTVAFKMNALMIGMPAAVREQMEESSLEEIREMGQQTRREVEEELELAQRLAAETGVELTGMRPFGGGVILTFDTCPAPGSPEMN